MTRSNQAKKPSKPITKRNSTKKDQKQIESKPTKKVKKGSKARIEVRKYSKTVDLLLKRASYRRVIMDRLKEQYFRLTGRQANPGEDLRIQAAAIESMQQSTEDFLQRIILFSNDYVNGMKKKRLYVKHVIHMANLLYPNIMSGITKKPRITNNSKFGRKFVRVTRKKKINNKETNGQVTNSEEEIIVKQ